MHQVSLITTADEEERLTEELFDLGAGSVSSCRTGEDEITLMALFEDARGMKSCFAQDSYVIRKLGEEVWKYRWLEDYQGFGVNDSIYILPVNSNAAPADRYSWVLRLDPRDAFGDGRHPTTSLCLIKLEERLRRFGPDSLATLKLMDVGTGTGVLAILAARMGVGAVDAIDIDDASVSNARYNAEINGCTNIRFQTGDIAAFHAETPYDLIIANLLTRIIKENIAHLIRLMKKDGTMIISGVSDQWHDEIAGLFAGSGLVVDEHVRRDRWNCYILTRRREGSFNS